jgi:hypothetical protein
MKRMQTSWRELIRLFYDHSLPEAAVAVAAGEEAGVEAKLQLAWGVH